MAPPLRFKPVTSYLGGYHNVVKLYDNWQIFHTYLFRKFKNNSKKIIYIHNYIHKNCKTKFCVEYSLRENCTL